MFSKKTPFFALALLSVAFCAVSLRVAPLGAQDARDFLTSDEILDCFYSQDLTELIEFSDEERILDLPFASEQTRVRAVFDRAVSLNCAFFSRYELIVELDELRALGEVTLYFHSGSGWYNFPVKTSSLANGKLQLTFNGDEFRTEENPNGLDKIDSIRISFWRSESVDAKIKFHSLRATSDPYLLMRVETEDGENDHLVDSLARALKRAGIKARQIDAQNATRDFLRGYSTVFVPLASGMTDETVDALCDFIDDGGRVFAFYSVPSKLLRKMGIKLGAYTNCEREGLSLGSMVFDEEVRKGFAKDGFELPQILRQKSWNFYQASPLPDSDARVIAYWGLKDGDAPTEYPAFIESSKGGYCSHVLLESDHDAEIALLQTLVGAYDRALPLQSVQNAWASIFRLGTTLDVGDKETRLSQLNEIEGTLAQDGWTVEEVARLLHNGQDVSNADLARLAQTLNKIAESRRRVYFSSRPSRASEGRLWWEHSGMGIYPGDWDRTMKELSEAGFNAVVPNMLWGGLAYYQSDVLPIDSRVEKYGDQIEQAVAAGKKYGIEVHAWMVCFNASTSPQWFLDKMRDEGRLQKDRFGAEQPWLCPSDPRNRALQLAALEEVATKYDVSGVHFDYIRFPDDSTCYCDGCKERFSQAYRAKTGEELVDFPQCVFQNDEIKRIFQEWRADQITALVRETHQKLSEKRPDLKFSAAVFSNYPAVKYSIGQDWGKWIDEGLLDFVCPMDYTVNDLSFANSVSSQLKYTKGKAPLYPGIGMTATGIYMDAEQVVHQAELARQAGAQGFTIFNLAEGTAKRALPALKAGITSQKAVLPHNEQKR